MVHILPEPILKGWDKYKNHGWLFFAHSNEAPDILFLIVNLIMNPIQKLESVKQKEFNIRELSAYTITKLNTIIPYNKL